MFCPLRTTARITAFRPGQSPPPVSTPTFMRLSSSRSSGSTTLATRRVLAGLTLTALAVALLPGVARAEPSLAELRAERAVLIRRIAALTDEATRLQARAVAGREGPAPSGGGPRR